MICSSLSICAENMNAVCGAFNVNVNRFMLKVCIGHKPFLCDQYP